MRGSLRPLCLAALISFLVCGAATASAQGVSRQRRARTKPAAAVPTKDKPASGEPAPTLAPATKDEATTAAPASSVAPSPEAEPTAGGEAAGKESAKSGGDSVVAGGADELELMRSRINEAKAGAERSRLQFALVGLLVEQGRKPEAVAALREMAGEERFDPAFFYNTGNALARLNESLAAADAYRKAISQRHGSYARAQHNLGVVLIRLGRWEEAETALTAALKLESYNYAEASYNLGRLHALRGEAGLAIQEWKRTLALQPDHADAAQALARAQAEDGDPQAALRLLDALSARYTRRGLEVPRALNVARGEIVAAGNLAREVGDAHPGPPESSAGPARLRSLSVDRDSYDLLQRARAARATGSNEEAVALYRRVLSGQRGYFPPANLELGYALAALRREAEAVAVLRPVAERDGASYPIAFYHLGRFYEQLGHLPLAAEAFTRAAAHYGDTNPQLLLDLSRVREKEGKPAEALAAMESYVLLAERSGTAPDDWARERLAALRQKVAAAQPPAPNK